ncbi:hypothetical protein BS636_02680 [Acinetobacter sp. LoGeW2-3]|uniref:HEPN domain-containing protein n=1 Tax=Acinetobacter sp. LoGeW2-3 TaxID=1808001 RepID=UPI000C05BD9F|nr:HEPN domain-containing protein [Acinetobacter sp. LoGeW2-3]ATO18643.1 hypothetical protein BS636_02680 [Acinetobacter sp. LoGeW2-3]
MLMLEEIYKSKKPQHSDYFNLRVQRGISWFKKALELDDELEFKFISLWISFNSIYAQETESRQDQHSLHQFLETLCQKDMEQKLQHIVWEKYSQPISALLNSPYTDQGFWDYRHQKVSLESCRETLAQQKQKIQKAVQDHNLSEMLLVIFNRLSSLHHQITQGGTTYHSSFNMKQLQNSCRVLAGLLPTFICILLENSATWDSGKPHYPVVQVS